MRRPSHAAGYSWRKWEDPIMRYRRPWSPDLAFWWACLMTGALFGYLTFR